MRRRARSRRSKRRLLFRQSETRGGPITGAARAHAAGVLAAANEYLRTQGIRISNGTIVDATIISAPSSTNNQAGKRDPNRTPQRVGTPAEVAVHASREIMIGKSELP